MSQRLGDLLVKEKIITHDQLDKALKAQRESGPNSRLGSTLVHLGFVSDEEVTNFLSRQYGVPAINLQYFEIDSSVVKLIPEETAKRYQILPLSRVGASLTIAMVDPTNVFAMDDIKFMTGFNIEPVVASESAIMDAIDKAYGGSQNESNVDELLASMGDEADVELQAEQDDIDLAELEKSADEAPIVKLVNIVMTDAVKRGASDIHIEPYEKEYRVRFRIDGVLQHIMSPPMKLKDAITSRIKILAKMDISEKRLPQDGRIMLKMQIVGKKKQLVFRVNC
ncbi:MAG TPA: ATPase, T2SS/T4P/T4SS family, partial [Candidatus Binatia bacterium]|nr:ATPase, T2SS/T4P/T4SS family [Candidatus Binatia bacterium]